jgi:adenosylcobinamide-phosphate synthase
VDLASQRLDRREPFPAAGRTIPEEVAVQSRSGHSPAAALIAGFLADLLAGDPRRWHPVAGFGQVASAVERAAYAPSRARGLAATALLVALPALAAQGLSRTCERAGIRRELVLAALTWAALGGRSLRREALHVGALLERGELEAARGALCALCGRDAGELDEAQVCRAVVESLAENSSDAVVGALLWGALCGPAGVSAYRAANTLDAMVGHRSERYREYGWSAARLDDAMNWPAARLTAALTCLLAPLVGGSQRATLTVARRDGGGHPSPNAGLVEAAFAGALGLTLGGPLAYGGHTQERPRMGAGAAPGVHDVERAARLSLAVGVATALVSAAVASARERSQAGDAP